MGGVNEPNCVTKYTRLIPINHQVGLKTESHFRITPEKPESCRREGIIGRIWCKLLCRGDLCELSVDTFSSLLCSKYRSVTRPQSFS